MLNEYYKDIRKYKILSVEEQLSLFNEKKFDLLFKSNLRLVISIAKQLCPHQLDDAIQMGNIGLLNGINTFNGTGNILSWFNANIRWEIMDYLTDNSNMIRVPRNRIKDEVKNIIIPTSTKIKDDFTIEDLLSDTINEYDNTNEVIREDLRQVISQMKEKYQRVIYLRYYEEKTLQEISIELNCSKQNVKIMENRILNKLKKIITNNPYK